MSGCSSPAVLLQLEWIARSKSAPLSSRSHVTMGTTLSGISADSAADPLLFYCELHCALSSATLTQRSSERPLDRMVMLNLAGACDERPSQSASRSCINRPNAKYNMT